jgi:hypothetical protein
MAKIEQYFDALVLRFGDLQWLEVAIQRQDGFTAVVRTVVSPGLNEWIPDGSPLCSSGSARDANIIADE